MDLKQLRSFVAVADCGSFTRAAEKLYISQPSVSAHVRQLEEELNEQLFLRTTKSLAITARGRELYEYAVHVLGMQERLLSRWAEEETRICIGASTIPSAYLLPELLVNYRAKQPDVTFEICQSDSRGVLNGLLDGRFELGFVGMESADERLVLTPFYRDTMVLITPNNEYFAELRARGADPAEILCTQPVLLREEGSGSRKYTDDFLRAAGVEMAQLSVTARLNDQESVKNLVAGGLGVAVTSEKAAEAACAAGKLIAFPLPGSAARELYLARRRGERCRPQTAHFAEFVTQFYREK